MVVVPASLLIPDSIWDALKDKAYDKRRDGALGLEKSIKQLEASKNPEIVGAIIDKLETDYLLATHPSNIRMGGFIGLAAVAIALGSNSGRHLKRMIPPVLSCLSDKDCLIRYYACESVYNIAKTAKGDILIYFTDIFDALSKLVADGDSSVRNAAELLDQLMRDTVSGLAASHVSVYSDQRNDGDSHTDHTTPQTALSVPRFIPLLKERINVIKTQTRYFLINWIILLNAVPDLYLVSYLPAFLGGLFKYLEDNTSGGVQNSAAMAIEAFLNEIKRISDIQRGLEKAERLHAEESPAPNRYEEYRGDGTGTATQRALEIASAGTDNLSNMAIPEYPAPEDEDLDQNDWIPGQNVNIDYSQILEILAEFLDPKVDDHIIRTALRWIAAFCELCPRAIVAFFPRLLGLIHPALGHSSVLVREDAARINKTLSEFIISISEAPPTEPEPATQSTRSPSMTTPEPGPVKVNRASNKDNATYAVTPESSFPALETETLVQQHIPYQEYYDIDYEAAESTLSYQFLNDNEDTKVSAIQWLIILHDKSPQKMLSIHGSTFPVLLKILSDPSETVVTKDLFLLSQISKHTEESYTTFMVHLLQLFSTDRRLLEARGSLIIRQLCLALKPERIYRAMAECLETSDDAEFMAIMVQNLNNNLMTAPEMHLLRKRLRSLDTKDGQSLFVVLFKPWCHNPVATFSLCLLAQAYEQAYTLLTMFGDIEMTVGILIQIDKLVQLIESPVFTYLRLQLLELDKYPYLHKCLYGLLMLLPQSSAFYALKNRLQSVSGIGYLNFGPTTGKGISSIGSTTSSTGRITPGQIQSSGPGYERSNRIKAREDGGVPWGELLLKFKDVQESRRKNALSENGTYISLYPSTAPQTLPRNSHPTESRKGPVVSSSRFSQPVQSVGAAPGSGGLSRAGPDVHNPSSSTVLRNAATVSAYPPTSATGVSGSAIPSPSLTQLPIVGSGVAPTKSSAIPVDMTISETPVASASTTAPGGQKVGSAGVRPRAQQRPSGNIR